VRILLPTGLIMLLAVATAAGDRAPGTAPGLPAAPSPNPGSATFPRFTIVGWVSPPTDFTTPERYAELADAGLNVTVLAWRDPGVEEENRKRLDCTRAVGVKNLLLDLRLDLVREADPRSYALLDTIVAAYRDDPAFLGYYLGDEPNESEFPRIAEWFRMLRQRDPLHPGYNNLRGRATFASHEAFLAHVRAYASQVKPAVITTDDYDHLVTRDRGQYVENVAGTAQVAREYGLPFWGFVLVIQHEVYRAVDDALLRWQVAQWLSYGAAGMGYFTYWTPAPDTAENWRDGMIRWGTGERSPYYEKVRALNRRIRPMGELLADLAWLSTEHAGGTPIGGTAFAADSLVAGVEGRAALGTFADPEGTPYLLLANRDSSLAQTLGLDLVGERSVDRFTDEGAWGRWPSTPTPTGRHIEVTLEAGDFTLLRVSGGCGALVAGGCRATLAASPNPATGRVRFAATRVHAPATLTLVDLNGRRVWARVLAGEAPVVEWDGRSDGGARVRPGFYWARLADARGSVVRRVAWLGGR
jgi:hypothetical protein